MATVTRVEVLNAPAIAGDLANVTFRVIDSGGVTRVAATSAGVAALAAGYAATFAYDLSWPPQARIDWLHSGVQVASDTFDVPAADSALLAAIYGKLNAAGLVVTAAAVVPADGGDVPVVSGDDYRAADGTALAWTVVTDLDLAAAQSLTLRIYDGAHEGAGVALSVPATASAVTDGYVLSADLTAAQTAQMTPRFAGATDPPQYGAAIEPRRRYEVAAVLSNGNVRTLLDGFVLVTE